MDHSGVTSLISSSCPRSTISSLCGVSQAFHATFTRDLYQEVIDPPLDFYSSLLLMDSINDADAHHPAHMILKLSLDTAANQLQLKDDEEQQFGENTWNLDDEITATALLKLYELLPQPQKQGGLPLRVLHVQSPGGICHLGSTLSQCHIFSNLKELVITTQRIASDCQMDFFKLPNLETLGFSIIFEGDLAEGSDIIKLGEGLQMLSGSSFLQALDLRLWCHFCDHDIQAAYRENIVDTLNTIHIPHLKSFKMSESCVPGCANGPSDHHDMTNIFSFLEAHTTLSHLTLDVRGTVIPQSCQILPQLHSFTGETDICVQLSAQGRRLDKLGLTFLYEGNLSETEESPTLDKLTSGSYLFLTTLDLHGLDADMWAVEIPKLCYPASANLFPSLASAFPNVVNLNIELGGCLAHYSEFIVSMTKLECLRVQEYRLHFSMEPKAVTELFPVGEYTFQIRELHLQLPRLASVTIYVLGDQIQCTEGICQDENDTCPHNHNSQTVPELGVEYKFSNIGAHRDLLGSLDVTTFKPEWYMVYQVDFSHIHNTCLHSPPPAELRRSWYGIAFFK
ncbi:hypothetical protein C8J57DRAFT_1236880 [Mycena rebaudengoi]|nr:hypothetical protein C8J57DRAFT_1236880 [Mycena rebaudengoi]